MAIEHACWVAEQQSKGYLVLRAFSNGPKRLLEEDAVFLQNKAQKLPKHLRNILIDWLRTDWHIFYGANSFRQERAREEYAIPGLIAHVDADGVPLPPRGPFPTRIVCTSPGNYQFLYRFDAVTSAPNLKAINRRLTDLVGGDVGAHHLAKLLRLPGTINWKPEYDPNPLVTLVPYDDD